MKNFGQRQGISKDLHVWSAQMGFSSVLMFHNLFISGRARRQWPSRFPWWSRRGGKEIMLSITAKWTTYRSWIEPSRYIAVQWISIAPPTGLGLFHRTVLSTWILTTGDCYCTSHHIHISFIALQWIRITLPSGLGLFHRIAPSTWILTTGDCYYTFLHIYISF